MSEDLQKAISAIKAGDKATGRKLLIKILKEDDKNEYAWLWMTKVVETNQQRRNCLKRVLEINPNNEVAKQGIYQLDKESSQTTKKKHKQNSKKRLRFWLLVGLGLLFLLCLLVSVITQLNGNTDSGLSTKSTEQNQEKLIVPAGQLSSYVDVYNDYDEVYIYKLDGTLDDRPNDLEELCLDYVYYRRKILEYEAAGKTEKADKARTSFKQVNLWIDEYDRSDHETMYFDILDLGN